MDTLRPATSGSTPSTPPPRARRKDKFRAAFAQLPQREREVAVLLYVKNLTLREIGEILGCLGAAICQIHIAMKRTLRVALDSDREIFRLVA